MSTQLTNALKNLGQLNATALNRKTNVKVFPTGLSKFDNEVLGTGGLVSGKVYEFYAKPSAGKTTLALKIIAHFQKASLLCAYFEAEPLFLGLSEKGRQDWIESLGVDLEELIMPDFQSGEDAFRQAKILIASGVNLIVFDTIATLQPEDLIFRENEKTKMNENQARAKMLTVEMNDITGGFMAYRKAGSKEVEISIDGSRLSYLRNDCGYAVANPAIHKLAYHDCVFLGINHAKDMIGVMYGDPTYSPGGAALGFHSSVRIGMSQPLKSKETVIDPITNQEVPLFRKTRLTASKNKLAPPFNETTLKIYRDGTILEDVVFWQEALKLGLVDVSLRTVTILENGERLSKKEFEIWAAENPDFFKGKVAEASFEAVEEDTEVDEEPEPQPENKVTTLKKLPSFLSKKSV